ncbi:MAG: 50S ribosomal protein L3 [Bdellovibrionales bacterium]|nr:50S ribosomal protein L3 [Bdellovibrionales bacterium]
MSEENVTNTESTEAAEVSSKGSSELVLNGLFATKLGMSTVFNDAGEAVPVTLLAYDNWKVTQVKTEAKEGYNAVQVSSKPKSARSSDKAMKGHLKTAGFATNAIHSRELRMDKLPEGLAVGQTVSINSLKKGDTVKLTSTSKGRGFSGVQRRHNFGGGPASHGSHFHRRPGSIGNREWPGRVMPGRKLAGQFGDETVTIKNVVIVDVLPDENVLMVKGGVPGGRHTLVKLVKE